MSSRSWRAIGASLVLAGIALVLWAAGTNAETLQALGAGFGIFGAAIILRTIRAGD